MKKSTYIKDVITLTDRTAYVQVHYWDFNSGKESEHFKARMIMFDFDSSDHMKKVCFDFDCYANKWYLTEHVYIKNENDSNSAYSRYPHEYHLNIGDSEILLEMIKKHWNTTLEHSVKREAFESHIRYADSKRKKSQSEVDRWTEELNQYKSYLDELGIVAKS